MNTLCKYRTVFVKEDVINGAINEVSVTSAEDVVEMLNSAVQLNNRPQEEVWVVHLNTKMQVIGIEMISMGSISSSLAAPADIFRGAIMQGAYAIVMAHNHPSGDPTPSKADIDTAKQLAKCGELLCIQLVDSIVIGGDEHVSLKTAGLM